MAKNQKTEDAKVNVKNESSFHDGPDEPMPIQREGTGGRKKKPPLHQQARANAPREPKPMDAPNPSGG